MKKSSLVRIITIMLVVMSLMAIAIPALAANSTVAKSKTKYKSYSISSSPSYSITVYGNAGDKLTIKLDLNDLEHPLTNGLANWKYSNAVTVTINSSGSATATIAPGSSFKYVSDRSNMARLRFIAPSTNNNDVTVYYPD